MTQPKYSDLSAVFLNCSLKANNNESHTQTLMNASIDLMEGAGVSVDQAVEAIGDAIDALENGGRGE